MMDKTYLLPAHVQETLGVVIVQPAAGLLHSFAGKKVLIGVAPASMQSQPHGEVQAALEADTDMLPFFMSDAVFSACGGLSNMELFSRRGNKCQLSSPGKFCMNELTLHERDDARLMLCWHHDHTLNTDPYWTPERIKPIIADIRLKMVLESIRRTLGVPPDRAMSMPELLWWAASNNVIDELPTVVIEKMAMYTPPVKTKKSRTGFGFVDTDARYAPDRDIKSEYMPRLKERQRRAEQFNNTLVQHEKPIKPMLVDDQPPASFMLRPKRIRWESTKYTRWVKTQPCVCCGATADDPHHLIGSGQGGTGTKAHDIFTFPLCRVHHDELHRDPLSWANNYGSQIRHVVKTLDVAFALGVLA
ncbi:MAG: DUF968 domain-containing protein [Plesiomonas shigelloides]